MTKRFSDRTALLSSITLSSAAQLFLKRGADLSSTPDALAIFHWLSSPWVCLGIVFTLLSLVGWMRALRTIPLSLAFNMAALSQVLVPLGSWLFFHEAIPSFRWLGIGLVFGGVVLLARPLAEAEEKL